MKYNIRGDKILVTDAIKEYITEKLDRLNKYFDKPDSITANVVIKVKGYDQTIEVTIPTTSFTIRNEESAEDLYAAIDRVSDKIEKAASKNFNLSYIEDDEEDIEESLVIKRKELNTKPMSEEEAILQMEMLGHDFFIYKDSETSKVCVLYKRKDNNYGLIETN